jgi:hypothetical protein
MILALLIMATGPCFGGVAKKLINSIIRNEIYIKALHSIKLMIGW